MGRSKAWWAVYVIALATGGMAGEWSMGMVGWSHRVLGDLLGLVVLTLPVCIRQAIQRRKASRYARLLARVR